jgi:hypothetical protein
MPTDMVPMNEVARDAGVTKFEILRAAKEGGWAMARIDDELYVDSRFRLQREQPVDEESLPSTQRSSTIP